MLEDAATRLDAGFIAPWVDGAEAASQGSGRNSNGSSSTGHQRALLRTRARDTQPRLQERRAEPISQETAKKGRRDASPISKHAAKTEALLTEAALAFTLAFCELDADSWHDQLQQTDDQQQRISVLQTLLDACIAEQPEGAAMTIKDMHTAWSAHVRLLPQEAPFVDVKIGQVACPTLPLLTPQGKAAETAVVEIPPVMHDVPVEPESGQLFPALFRIRQTQALVCGFSVSVRVIEWFLLTCLCR